MGHPTTGLKAEHPNARCRYLEKHGKPIAFYSDKHSVLRINEEGELGRDSGVLSDPFWTC